MVWIREAEEAGRVQAEEEAAREAARAAEKAAFDAEPVSERKVAAFLRRHQAPVLPLVVDLRKAGYKVERKDPGYVHHSYKREPGSEEDLRRFTLTRVVESPGWGMTDYSKWEREVFALEWTVSRERPDRHNPLLGTVSIYPTMDERTHYAGVQYRATAAIEWPPKPHVVDSPDITVDLQQTVQGWIAKAQAPVVVKR